MSSSQFSPVFSPQNDSRNSGLNEYELDLVSRGRSRSTIMREKWLRDFNNGIRQGEGDWKGDRNMDEIEIPDNLQKLDLKDECILILPDKNKGKIAYRLPILQPTLGEASIDIRQLHPKLNITTYDPGYMSTASCHSAITYIDGNQGILSHRGYRIEDLFEHSDYVELCFLLLYGELPSKNDKIEHENQIKQHMLVHEKLIQFYKGFRYDAHPMAIMCAVVGGLSSFYHEELDIQNPDHRLLCAYRLIAKMPTLAAIAYKTSKDQPVVYPKKKYSYAENFLYMMFSTPVEEYVVNPMMAKALDAFLMLHADHEQNASTSTVRIAGSSHANPFACVACGITALWGPQHGGANEAVLKMLEEIGSKDRIPEYIKKAKDKKDPFRLMGFGHRVYKNYDPRAKIMQKICHDLLTALNKKNEPLLELALELERIALSDDYFKSRKLYPNVDFYSGIVLKALNIPETMFTVLFAVARTVGWVAHWKEMIEDPKQRIGRPRQLYVGKNLRKFVPIDKRTHIGIESGWV